MLRVALTGGMGSGKSTAAAIFREQGCFVSQSDEVARAMMQPGQAVYHSIVNTFGTGVIAYDGALDRAALARIAFADGRIEVLNSIVHPAVIAWQSEWMHGVGAQHPGAVAIVESALIFESRHGAAAGGTSSWQTRFDRIVLVTAPEQVRVDRSVQRYLARVDASSSAEYGAAEADVRARMREQMPEEQKRRLADTVVENNGSLEDLRRRVVQVSEQLWREAGGGQH